MAGRLDRGRRIQLSSVAGEEDENGQLGKSLPLTADFRHGAVTKERSVRRIGNEDEGAQNLRTVEVAMELDRITFDSQIMDGRACIRGRRITVSLIVNLVANGMSTDQAA